MASRLGRVASCALSFCQMLRNTLPRRGRGALRLLRSPAHRCGHVRSLTVARDAFPQANPARPCARRSLHSHSISIPANNSRQSPSRAAGGAKRHPVPLHRPRGGVGVADCRELKNHRRQASPGTTVPPPRRRLAKPNCRERYEAPPGVARACAHGGEGKDFA